MVSGRIFATLGYPDERWAVVKLSLEQQAAFVKSQFTAFVPAKARRGSTHILLERIDEAPLRSALNAAWLKAASKGLVAEFDENGPASSRESLKKSGTYSAKRRLTFVE